jgi:ribosomal protein S15P/S13E
MEQSLINPTPAPTQSLAPAPMYPGLPEAEQAAEDTLSKARTGSVKPVDPQLNMDIQSTTTFGGGSSSTTTQEGIDVTDLPAYKDWLASSEKAAQIGNELVEAHKQKANAEFAGKQQLADLEAENARLMEAKEKVRQEKLNQAQLQVSDEMDKVANFEFKPWSEKGNNRITAVISVVLAGISQMLSHGSIGKNTGLAGGPTSNNALDKQIIMLDKIKEDDLKMQKQQWEQAKTKIDQAKTKYGMLVEKFGDERVAEAALRAQQSRAIQAEIEKKLSEYARNTGGGLDAIKDKFGFAQFEQKAAADRLQFEAMAKNRITKTDTTETPKTVTQTRIQPKDTLALTKEASALRNEYDAKVKDARTDMREISNIENVAREAAKGNQQAINQLSTLVSKIAQSGNMTEGDIKRAGANASQWQEWKGYAIKKLWGEMTEHEKRTTIGFIKAYKNSLERAVAQQSSNYINLARKIGLPEDQVVIDPDEHRLGVEGPIRKSGLEKHGGKKVTP